MPSEHDNLRESPWSPDIKEAKVTWARTSEVTDADAEGHFFTAKMKLRKKNHGLPSFHFHPLYPALSLGNEWGDMNFKKFSKYLY